MAWMKPFVVPGNSKRILPRVALGMRSRPVWGVKPMGVIYHRLINKDLRLALDYYESEGGEKLADRFFDEVETTVANVLEYPTRYHVAEPERELRRAPFRSFRIIFYTRCAGPLPDFLFYVTIDVIPVSDCADVETSTLAEGK